MIRNRAVRVRTSTREWVARGFLVLLVAALGFFEVAHTLAYAMRLGNPSLAHAMAGNDGRVTATLATSLARGEASAADRQRADRLARIALRQDPTTAAAASTLGLDAQIRGDTALARRQFAYAERLSRRDLQTQLWAIEDSVSRGDIVGALKHYDIALRTSRNTAEVLFPVLTGALSDRSVRAALVDTLARRPTWTDGFIAHVAGDGRDPGAAAALFTALSRARVPISGTAQTGVVNNLIVKGAFDEAWAYYASLHPGVDRRQLRDRTFAADIETPSLLDWITVNDSGLTSTIEKSDNGGVVSFSASNGVGGPLLRQVQFLPPGKYKLIGHSSDIDQLEDAMPYFGLKCADGREAGQVNIPNSSASRGIFFGRFVVPSDCPMQTLMLIARPSDKLGGVFGQIDQINLISEIVK